MNRPPRRGLGRGLASLIPDSALDLGPEGAAPAPTGVRSVPLDEVKPNPEQPRTRFDKVDLDELAESIKAHGVLTPLLVRKQGGHYVLIAGERRLRAAGLAGLTEVPVMLKQADDPRTQLELALVENLQRADLDPVDAATGYQRLIEEFSMTQEQVAERVGKDRSTVANALRLLRLEDFVLDALRDGRITAGHARALVPLDDVEDVRVVLAKVIAQQLSVRATERMVAQLTRTRRAVRNADKAKAEQALQYATKVLSDSLHASVAIRPRRKGGGRIVIEYADNAELERLIKQMRSEG